MLRRPPYPATYGDKPGHDTQSQQIRTTAMDPTFLPATALADMVRAGKLGALELLDHFIARTERLNPRINAVVVRDFDRARERARELDSRADKSAPLFGVPDDSEGKLRRRRASHHPRPRGAEIPTHRA